MPPSLPRRADRTRLQLLVAATVLVGPLLLVGASPARAATSLQNPTVSPAEQGTTADTFVITVGYISEPEGHAAVDVVVEVVGLGGGPFPMSRVSGSTTNGTWQATTMLPAGSWQLIFRATSSPLSQSPPALNGPVVEVQPSVTPPPTPSPSPGGGTPVPTSTPTPSPTASPSPSGSTPATSAPTPLPPGVTPRPTPRPAASPTPGVPAPPSAGATATAAASDRPTSSESPSAGTQPPATARGSAAPEGSPAPSPEASGDESTGGGWGRTGWIVLGGMTSVAGAAVLGRQWLSRRTGLPG